MRIESSSLGMESAVRKTTLTVTTRKFTFKEYRQGEELGGSLSNLPQQEDENQSMVKKDKDAETLQNLKESMESAAVRRAEIPSAREDFADTFRYFVAKYIMMLLFGEEKTADLWKDAQSQLQSGTGANSGGQSGNGNALLSMQPLSMRVFSYEEETFYQEEQNFSFTTVGTVKTEDGRELNFNVDINMSHSFSSYYRQELDLASFMQVCDPLVINFDRNVAGLEDQKFYFDLDADGKEEEIATLSEGSGYLALDRNQDGKINDGSELFGPQSGDGFSDLAEYDEDGNGWIDENDSIWSSLKIWCKNKDGSDSLYTLVEKGVGAICLSKVNTDYTLRNQQAESGYLRSTGVFLFEDGRAGTMQHLDLVR